MANEAEPPIALITGAAGFVGGHAVSGFAEIGYRPVPVARSGGVTDAWSCDLTDRAAVRELIRSVRPDRVLHLAGRNHAGDSWRDPAGYLESNVMATVYLLDALRQEGSNARVLVAGSMLSVPLGAQPQPPHPYSLSKSLQELAAQSWQHLFGGELLVVRPSNLIGPGPSGGICTRLAAWIADRERGGEAAFRLQSLAEPRDYLDVRDAVRAFGLLLEQGKAGRVYPLGSGVSRTLADVLAAFRELSPAADEVQTPDSAMPMQTPDSAKRSASPSAAVEARALRRLGWQPTIPFRKSLLDTLTDYRGGKGVRVWETS
ncbi:NAD-dependent epimerase/dehydratase family protein [Gorillibacterium sp. sgz500922]|uniref:NAD-dependent epimerase/dehydratase family protein n=1 Tax=Gorillibacterium sp. sgz500922 TaxID=3446694 RepID=UPI003F664A72